MELSQSSPAFVPGADPSIGLERIDLARAIEQAAEAVVITDPTGKIQYVNPAFTHMTGFGAEEAIGQNPRLLNSGQHRRQYYEDLWKTILDGRVWRGEVVNRRKDGTLYTEQMSIAPVRDECGRAVSFIAIKQDVSERRAVEEAHRFLASIVEFADDAILGGTPDGIIQTWNRAAGELYGYRAAEVIGKSGSLLMAPEYLDHLQTITQGLIRGESSRQFETVALRKDGSRFEVSLSASPIRNSAGEVTGAAAIIRDITRQRDVHRALQASEERFWTAFEHAPVGMCLSLSDSRILHVNTTLCRMLGYSEAELIDLGWSGITHPDDWRESGRALERLERDRPPCVELENRYIHRNGEVVWARVRISIVDEADGSLHFVTYVEDITERKRTEKLVRRTEAKYRRLVENLPDVTWTSNVNGQTVHVSPNIESVCGYTPEEVRGEEKDPWFGRIHPDDLCRVTEAFRELIEHHRPFDVEYQVRHKDGRWIWVQNRAIRTFLEDGVVYADGVLSEITSRKRAGEALRESEERYRALFENMHEGVSCCQMLFQNGEPRDFLYLAVNQAFESHTGLAGVVGRKVSEILPGIFESNQERFEQYGAVVLTGQPARFETYVPPLKKWFSIAAYSLGSDRFVAVLNNITDLKMIQAAADERARLASLGAEVGLVLTSAGTIGEGLQRCAEALVRYTGAAFVRAWTLNDRTAELELEASAGLYTHLDGAHGRVRVGEFKIGRIALRGTPYLSSNVLDDPEISNPEWARRESLAAFAGYPLIVDEHVVGVVAAFKREPFGEDTIRAFASVSNQIAQFITRKRAEADILASLKEKEALLREIHHRVKNNLQIVCSLLKLNSRNLTDADAKDIFVDMQNRVKSMALVHETLYRSGNLAGINFSEYVPQLTEHLLRAYGLSPKRVKLGLEVESVVLPIDVAIPCALMLTELVSNSAKHVFAVKQGGELRILFRRSAEPMWLLEVEDSGGCDVPEPAPGHGCFGLELIRLLTEQLNGSLRIQRTPAFCVSVTFPHWEPSGQLAGATVRDQ